MSAGPHTISIHKDSPLCGDVIDLTAQTWDGQVTAATYSAHACSLVKASSTILTRKVPGLSIEQALALSREVGVAMRGEGPLPAGFDDVAPALLMPARRKCVLLAWDALSEALA